MNESLCKINLLGTVITVRTEEDLHYIKQLEHRLSETIEQVKNDLTLGEPLSIAIMAGIYLADENFRLKRQAPTISLNQSLPQNVFNLQSEEQKEDALSRIGQLLDQTLSQSK
jgi:cell division protein ZapA (FtsZ GTPase activity inhibitor)